MRCRAQATDAAVALYRLRRVLVVGGAVVPRVSATEFRRQSLHCTTHCLVDTALMRDKVYASVGRPSVRPSVCPSVRPFGRRATLCRFAAVCPAEISINCCTAGGMAVSSSRRSTVRSSKCEQCRVVSSRRKLHTDVKVKVKVNGVTGVDKGGPGGPGPPNGRANNFFVKIEGLSSPSS